MQVLLLSGADGRAVLNIGDVLELATASPKSVGLAIADLVAAHLAATRARDRNIGPMLEF